MPVKLSELLRKKAHEYRLSYKDLGLAMGLGPSTIGSIIRKPDATPRATTIRAIHAWLVSKGELIGLHELYELAGYIDADTMSVDLETQEIVEGWKSTPGEIRDVINTLIDRYGQKG